jgi:hypothetical protein
MPMPAHSGQIRRERETARQLVTQVTASRKHIHRRPHFTSSTRISDPRELKKQVFARRLIKSCPIY